MEKANKVLLIQNQGTDPKNSIRYRVEGFFKDRGYHLDTFIIDGKGAEVPKDLFPDMILVIGGDGTLLKAIKRFSQVPYVIGINSGHLGFLTSINADKVESYLEALVEGNWTYQERLKICLGETEALNDIVFKSTNSSRMVKINTYLVCKDGSIEEFADYDADGLIIATPTGSTAYNMASGGSIIDPTTKVIAVTPICPHSLSAKPIVISPEYPIIIESDLSNEGSLTVSVDGVDIMTMEPGERVTVEDKGKVFNLVSFPELKSGNHYSLLKQKLGWTINLRAAAKRGR